MKKNAQKFTIVAIRAITDNHPKKEFDVSQHILYHYDSSNAMFFNESVVMSNKAYQTIFGCTKSKVSYQKKLLSVVKITINGKSIHRKYVGLDKMNGHDQYAAITYASMQLLGNEGVSHIIQGQEATLSSGSPFIFFWTHPDNAVRVAVKLGTLSIALAILGVIVAFL